MGSDSARKSLSAPGIQLKLGLFLSARPALGIDHVEIQIGPSGFSRLESRAGFLLKETNQRSLLRRSNRPLGEQTEAVASPAVCLNETGKGIRADGICSLIRSAQNFEPPSQESWSSDAVQL